MAISPEQLFVAPHHDQHLLDPLQASSSRRHVEEYLRRREYLPLVAGLSGIDPWRFFEK
jgi:hypothetical protein